MLQYIACGENKFIVIYLKCGFFRNFDNMRDGDYMKQNEEYRPVDISTLLGKNEDDPIGFRKFNSKYRREIDRRTHTDKCYICKKECKGFCNSHTIPRFSLEKIAQDGMLFNNFAPFDIAHIDSQNGVEKSIVFHLICQACDGSIFQDYENEENYVSPPSQVMLAEIVLKLKLRYIWLKHREIEAYKILTENIPSNSDAEYVMRKKLNEAIYFRKKIENEYSYAKNIINSKGTIADSYQIELFAKLPYRTAVAVQEEYVVYVDLQDEIIYNIYDTDNKKIKYQRGIYVCVFPMSSFTVLLVFRESNNKDYMDFFSDFNVMTLDQKLQVLNYIIFSYGENYMISPSVPKETIDKLKIAAEKNDVIRSRSDLDPKVVGAKHLINSFSFSKMDSIPNLLDSKYALPL